MMKYVNQFLLLVVLGLFGFVLFYSFTGGLYYLFVFPILFLCTFLAYYLHKQMEEDDKARVERGIDYAVEDADAEKWVKDSFAPDTLSYIKTNRWSIVIYSFLVVGIAAFAWSYLSYGFWTAVANFAYASVVFWMFLLYVLVMPVLFDLVLHLFPKSWQRGLSGDWERGYFFLFPISFVIYVFYPFHDVLGKVQGKLFSFPIFFLIYTFVFLALYCMVYLYEQMQEEDEKRVEKQLKKMMSEEEKKE